MKQDKMHLGKLLIAGLMLGSSTVYADDDLDVTMRMVPADVELPDAVTKVIELPTNLPEQANPNSARGMETANEMRTTHREAASEIVENARSRRPNK